MKLFMALTNEAGPELNLPYVLAVGTSPEDLWGRLGCYCDGKPGEEAWGKLMYACGAAAAMVKAHTLRQAAFAELPHFTLDEEGTEAYIQCITVIEV